MKYLLHTVLVFLSICLAAACSDTCTENKNALPRAGFYGSGMAANTKVNVDSIVVIGVGMPGDSALSGPQSKNELYMPFRIDSDTTGYVFVDARRNSGLRDTVTFVYDRVPRFVNVECGVSYLFEMKSITCQGVLIDSVTCPNGYIDNTNSENLHIYFATGADQ